MALTAREKSGYKVNSLSLSVMPGEGNRLQLWWKYPTNYLYSITGFKVLWYAYGDQGASYAWVAESVTVDKDESTGGWWQHVLTAPDDLEAKWLYAWVAPVASGKWKSGPDWSKSSTVASPRASADQQAAMGQLSSVGATMDHGAVTITWQRVNGYQRWANVYCSTDGGAYTLLRQVDAALGEFTDSGLKRGHSYRYRLRAAMSDGVTLAEATEVAAGDSFDAAPLPVTGLEAHAYDSTHAKLTWQNQGVTGEGYEIQYSSNPNAWADNVTADITTDTLDQPVATAYTFAVQDTGRRWYARVRRVNDEGGSDWTGLASTVLGTRPEPPTLGALPTYVAADGELAVAWAHNSEDGSDQTAYEVQVNGATAASGIGTASTAALMPSALSVGDGGSMAIRVRTKGAYVGGENGNWSDWSEQPVVAVWAVPTAGMSVVSGGSEAHGEASEMPLQLRVTLPSYVAGNHAVAWWAEVAANEAHPSTGPDGGAVSVAAGEVLWHADGIPDDGTTVPASGDACNRVCLLVTVTAADLRMEPNVSYVARGGCVTAAGMRATCEAAFAWLPSGAVPEPDATAEYDPATLSMRLTVSCEDEGEPVAGVTVAVWRVESGGSTVLVADGLAHGGSCVDPHPDFGECTYRIVATDAATGAQASSELAADVDEGAVVIQWGERWDGIVAADEVAPGVLSYAGQRVRLPYGIDLEEERERDMAEVEYLGRERPVLYVGSTVRQDATVACDLYEPDDPGVHGRVRELLDAGGPCYVRTPSGAGFWASARGSLSASMGGLSRLTLRLKRVEG